MKKSIWIFIVVGLVALSTIFWLMHSAGTSSPMEYIHVGVILLVICFALFVGFKKWKSSNRGEPEDDELSRKVMQRTAALSYYISLYIWVFLLFLKDRVRFDTEELLGTGILSMALVFGITWIILNAKGAVND